VLHNYEIEKDMGRYHEDRKEWLFGFKNMPSGH